jgi:hypothetical protein
MADDAHQLEILASFGWHGKISIKLAGVKISAFDLYTFT